MQSQRTTPSRAVDSAGTERGTLVRSVGASGVSASNISHKTHDTFDLAPAPTGVRKHRLRAPPASSFAQSIAKRLWPDDDVAANAEFVKLALKVCKRSASDATLKTLVLALRNLPAPNREDVCTRASEAYVGGMKVKDTVQLLEMLASKGHKERWYFVERLRRTRETWKRLGRACRQEAFELHACNGVSGIYAYSERRAVPTQLVAWASSLRHLLRDLRIPADFPDLCDEQTAKQLVEVFGYAFAPTADEMHHDDYASAVRLAPRVYAAFMAFGDALMAGHFERAGVQANTLRLTYRAAVHHDQRWRETLQTKAWIFDDAALSIPEPIFHRLIVQPELRLSWCPSDSQGTRAALMARILAQPRGWAGVIEVMTELGGWLKALSPDDAQSIDAAYDVSMLQREATDDAHMVQTVYRMLHYAATLAKPRGIDAATLDKYADFPADKLADAIVDTCKAVWQRRSRLQNARIREHLPNVIERGIAWEKENFRARLERYHGRAPRTERWIDSVPPRADETMRVWHARAITHYLLNAEQTSDVGTPETLMLAEPLLRSTMHRLNEITRAGVGELLFAGMLRARGSAAAASERQAVQMTLLALPKSADRAARVTAVTEQVMIAATVALRARNLLTPDVDLVASHQDNVVQDLKDFSRATPALVRQRIATDFARQIVEPNLHDDPDQASTPLARAVEAAADDVRRLAHVDLQVHGEHYSRWLSRAGG